MNGDRLVSAYLAELEAATRPLPARRRSELVGEVRDHIETDLARTGRRDEATVRNSLERLGSPESIVAAELGADGGTRDGVPTEGVTRPGLGNGEILAILLLTVGAVIAPVIGPAIGLVLVWSSARWARTTKLVITAVAIVLLVLPVVLLMSLSTG